VGDREHGGRGVLEKNRKYRFINEYLNITLLTTEMFLFLTEYIQIYSGKFPSKTFVKSGDISLYTGRILFVCVMIPEAVRRVVDSAIDRRRMRSRSEN